MHGGDGQTLQVRRIEVYTIPTVLPTNTESKGARTHSHALTGKRLAHTCAHALQWRAHRDPPPKSTWREAWREQPLLGVQAKGIGP